MINFSGTENFKMCLEIAKGNFMNAIYLFKYYSFD
tara:strand:+ start:156 stop:260 length:105 start_codon:yes stop_codon:yes gene_type:complete